MGALPIEQGGTRIKYIEIFNEVMRWWDRGGANDAAYMHPEEFAAMLLVCYRAIRKVSDVGVIMGGTTALELDYLKAMFAHADKIAPGEKITDKIVVHYYLHEGNEYGKHPPTWWNSGACMPEEDKGLPKLKEIVAFGKSRGLETWLNEFGSDTEGPSWMHISGSRYGMTDQQAQGEQLARTFKALGSYGVERAYMFMASDENGGPGLWQRCGLLTGKTNGYQAKPAMAATVALINEIGVKAQALPGKKKKQAKVGVSTFKMPQAK